MGFFLLLPHSVSAKMFVAFLKAFMLCDILCCHTENTLCTNGEMEISRCVHFLFVLLVCIEMFAAGCNQMFLAFACVGVVISHTDDRFSFL